MVGEYGRDASAWAMLTAPARETPVFDQGLLLQGEGSEFFRVRYAYARSRALLRNAGQLGFGAEAADVSDAPELLRALADYPLVLEAAAHHRAPERLARYLVELADALLDFQHRVLPQGTRNARPPTVPGWLLPKPPGRCWPAAWPCSASTHPNACDP